jgi:tRNA threonylcarbamoyladenosine biosynthesis protein TsaE
MDAPGPGGLVVSLRGDLGAGKTVFVKGLARGLGIDESWVSSPTFVLANQYVGREEGLSLHHVDFYRLESPDELESMGFFDLIGPRVLLAVEWGPKFAGELPSDRLELELQPDREGRVLQARAGGPEAARVLAAWSASLAE